MQTSHQGREWQTGWNRGFKLNPARHPVPSVQILNQFSPIDEDLAGKQKYAYWRAAEIRKAVREGRPAVSARTITLYLDRPCGKSTAGGFQGEIVCMGSEPGPSQGGDFHTSATNAKEL